MPPGFTKKGGRCLPENYITKTKNYEFNSIINLITNKSNYTYIH